MRIGIDARMYSQSGIGRYTRNLIKKLEILDSKNEYFVLLIKEDFDKVEFKKNFQKVLADFSWYGITEQVRLPTILNSLKLDLVHFPHFNVPVFYGGKFVVTIHDLIHQHFQMKRATTKNALFYKTKQIGYSAVFRFAIKKSQKILVPSEYVKDSLIKDWKVSPEKIIVTPEGVDDKILSIEKEMSEKESKGVLTDLKIREPYLFYLGNAHPHKNVEKLIEVFYALQKKYTLLQLVLSGNDHYFWKRLQDEVIKKGLDENIRFTGYVTDEQVVALYKNAVCFVLPSLEEGFGIPLLEAMASNCPVVSSKAGSLQEVGADAAIYFDPTNIEDMKEKIEQVLHSEKLRQELIKKGQKRIKQFSWEILGKQTLEVYESNSSTHHASHGSLRTS